MEFLEGADRHADIEVRRHGVLGESSRCRDMEASRYVDLELWSCIVKHTTVEACNC